MRASASSQSRAPRQQVLLIAPFPPPVHGQALASAGVKKALDASGAHGHVIDLASHALKRSWHVRIRRIGKVLAGLIRLIWRCSVSRPRGVYIGVSGGYGKVYEVFFVLIARLYRVPLYLHHECFSYTARRSWVAAGLIRVAGKNASHIVLCEEMGNRLGELYSAAARRVFISNAAFVGLEAKPGSETRSAVRTIGFLSNITAEKGIFDFLAVARALADTGWSPNFKIAGPFEGQEVERRVRLEIDELKHVEYVGSKYGAQKEEFLRAIDVLVFPTRYVNEAEPFVILEAFAAGAPVIAGKRGCIASMVGKRAGLVVSPEEDFRARAVAQLTDWHENPDRFSMASRAAEERFTELREGSAQRLARMCDDIVGVRHRGPGREESVSE